MSNDTLAATTAAPGAAKSTALAKPGRDIRDMIQSEHFRRQVEMALPRHMSPDRFARVVLTALTRTPKLLDCTQESLLRCCMDLSQIGLEADGRNAHLIPFKRSKKDGAGQWQSWHECQLIVDWKGYVALARRSGTVSLFRPVLVKEQDVFAWRNGVVTHEINWREDRGKTDAVYSYVKFKDGEEDWEVMTIAEVNEIRRRSKAADDGPWVTDFDEMAKKTVIRRHSKRLDLTPEMIQAIDVDDDRSERMAAGREVPAAEVPQLFSKAEDKTVAMTGGNSASDDLSVEPAERLSTAGNPSSQTTPPPKQTRAKRSAHSASAGPAAQLEPEKPPPEPDNRSEFWGRCGAAKLDSDRVLDVLRRNSMTQAALPEDLTEDDAAAVLPLFDKLVSLCRVEGGLQ